MWRSFNFVVSFSRSFVSTNSVTGFNYQNQTYTVTMQSSSICSDSEISTISQGSFVGQAMREKPNNDAIMNSTFMVDNQVKQQQQQQQSLTAPLEQQQQPSQSPLQEQQQQKQQAPLPPPPPQPPLQHQQSNQDSEYYNEEELWRMMDGDELDSSGDQTHRPAYLELAGNSGSTPIVSRKPRFQFSSMYIAIFCWTQSSKFEYGGEGCV